MKVILFHCLISLIKRIISSDLYAEIRGYVMDAETLDRDNAGRREWVMTKARWIVHELRRGTQSDVLKAVASTMVAIAVEAAVAQLKLEIEK
jgi:hypothetical protein